MQRLEPESVRVMSRLEPGDPGVVNHKSPTTLLLDHSGGFHSFGFTARDFYHDLSPREAKNWLYFDKFKMALHNTKVSVSVVVVLEESPVPRGYSRTNLQILVLVFGLQVIVVVLVLEPEVPDNIAGNCRHQLLNTFNPFSAVIVKFLSFNV